MAFFFSQIHATVLSMEAKDKKYIEELSSKVRKEESAKSFWGNIVFERKNFKVGEIGGGFRRRC